jgi:histidinol-phosphatase (PHP family)
MDEAELPAYNDWIDRARAAAGPLPVRAGLECDWLPGCESWIEDLAGRYPWDYLIGSVHYLGDWDFDNPKWLGRWAEADVEAVWTHYWKTYAAMARSRLFDIMGHPDLVKKFGHIPKGDLLPYYREALDAIAASGMAIEVSTAGLRKEVGEIYPSAQFLQQAFRRKIPILISSDSHAPGEVGHEFQKAVQLVKEIGYRELTAFAKRKPVKIRLY